MPLDIEKKIMRDQEGLVRQELEIPLPMSVNLSNEASQSGLTIACKHKSVETAKLFLEKSANVNLTDSYGFSALLYATTNELKEVVKLLIQAKALIEARTNEGETALHIAAKHNFVDIVQHLLYDGADINAKTNKGENALSLAAAHNSIETVKCLLRYSRFRMEDINNALVKAIEENFMEIANELVLNGADVYYSCSNYVYESNHFIHNSYTII